LPVETDVDKLVTYCCGLNTLKTDGEEVKLKPDSEYPEWLWKLTLNGAPALEDMDPDTLDYWIRKRDLALRYKNKQMKNKYPEPFLPKRITNLRMA
jgi:large subunit ribosomal protein L54